MAEGKDKKCYDLGDKEEMHFYGSKTVEQKQPTAWTHVWRNYMLCFALTSSGAFL